MPTSNTEFTIAETYLKEMLEADNSGNYDLYIKRFEPRDLEDFTKERFENDIKQMREKNGMNVSYEYFGVLQAPREDKKTRTVVTKASNSSGKVFMKNAKP